MFGAFSRKQRESPGEAGAVAALVCPRVSPVSLANSHHTMPTITPPSDKFCSLTVLDSEALKSPDAQQKYQQMWGEVLEAGVSVKSRLQRNRWMEKLMTVETHPHIFDSSDEELESPRCSVNHNPASFHSPRSTNRGRTSKVLVSSPTSVLAEFPDDTEPEASVAGDACGGAIGPAGAVCPTDDGKDWSQFLDPHSLDEILSRMSLQSLAVLSCVSKGMRKAASGQLVRGGSSRDRNLSLLLSVGENLGPTYEPSTLHLPLNVSDLPAVQRWDRYSIFVGLVSKLYERLAEAFPHVLHFQRSV